MNVCLYVCLCVQIDPIEVGQAVVLSWTHMKTAQDQTTLGCVCKSRAEKVHFVNTTLCPAAATIASNSALE